jgi:flagellar biosynthesis/type III secretory pathway chaperone
MKKLVKYLKFELKAVSDLVELAKNQQDALIKYNIDHLRDINEKQSQISEILSKVEKARIGDIADWLKITYDEAARLSSSQLMSLVEPEIAPEIKLIKSKFSTLVSELIRLNKENRILTVRAGISISEMMKYLTSGAPVCNVQV